MNSEESRPQYGQVSPSEGVSLSGRASPPSLARKSVRGRLPGEGGGVDALFPGTGITEMSGDGLVIHHLGEVHGRGPGPADVADLL